MTPDDARQLFDYNGWANQRSLEAAGQLSEEQFNKPLGSSFPSIRDTLAHICGGEWVWLERLNGRVPTALPTLPELQTVAGLRQHWQPQNANLVSFVAQLTQNDLDSTMEYKTFNFGSYQNPVWQSLHHLANHGTYHRGQVATMIRQLGGKPILTDLMHFYRERATNSRA